jgi:hypothetical protein
MSVLSAIVVVWLALNAAVFTALMLRRSRAKLRDRLFRWVIGGGPRRERSRRAFRRSVGR